MSGVHQGAAQCRLSAEHIQILALLAEGLSEQEVADRQFLSYRTVRRRIQEVMRWHSIRTKAQLGAETIRRGWADAVTDEP